MDDALIALVGIDYGTPPDELMAAWLHIGKRNPWIRGAYDPPFTRDSFYACSSVEELQERLHHGNWCLGQAFTLGNLAFINQVEGGDEWLVIRGRIPFESLTSCRIIECGEFPALVERFQRATDAQLKSLDY